MDTRLSSRLFTPTSESTILDNATNGNFHFGNLIGNRTPKLEAPKDYMDRASRYVVRNGSLPPDFHQKLEEERKKQQQQNDPNQTDGQEEDGVEDTKRPVKEETTMLSNYSAHLYKPGFGLQEGGMGKCNCGKKECPICGKGKAPTSKIGMHEAEGNSTGIGQGVGLGTPQSTANHLYQIPINQYQDSDASFVSDGDSAETSKTNIPALLAAKNAGGQPHPFTVSNGINKRSGTGGFKLKPLRDDLGPNG